MVRFWTLLLNLLLVIPGILAQNDETLIKTVTNTYTETVYVGTQKVVTTMVSTLLATFNPSATECMTGTTYVVVETTTIPPKAVTEKFTISLQGTKTTLTLVQTLDPVTTTITKSGTAYSQITLAQTIPTTLTTTVTIPSQVVKYSTSYVNLPPSKITQTLTFTSITQPPPVTSTIVTSIGGASTTLTSLITPDPITTVSTKVETAYSTSTVTQMFYSQSFSTKIVWFYQAETSLSFVPGSLSTFTTTETSTIPASTYVTTSYSTSSGSIYTQTFTVTDPATTLTITTTTVSASIQETTSTSYTESIEPATPTTFVTTVVSIVPPSTSYFTTTSVSLGTTVTSVSTSIVPASTVSSVVTTTSYSTATQTTSITTITFVPPVGVSTCPGNLPKPSLWVRRDTSPVVYKNARDQVNSKCIWCFKNCNQCKLNGYKLPRQDISGEWWNSCTYCAPRCCPKKTTTTKRPTTTTKKTTKMTSSKMTSSQSPSTSAKSYATTLTETVYNSFTRVTRTKDPRAFTDRETGVFYPATTCYGITLSTRVTQLYVSTPDPITTTITYTSSGIPQTTTLTLSFHPTTVNAYVLTTKTIPLTISSFIDTLVPTTVTVSTPSTTIIPTTVTVPALTYKYSTTSTIVEPASTSTILSSTTINGTPTTFTSLSTIPPTTITSVFLTTSYSHLVANVQKTSVEIFNVKSSKTRTKWSTQTIIGVPTVITSFSTYYIPPSTVTSVYKTQVLGKDVWTTSTISIPGHLTTSTTSSTSISQTTKIIVTISTKVVPGITKTETSTFVSVPPASTILSTIVTISNGQPVTTISTSISSLPPVTSTTVITTLSKLTTVTTSISISTSNIPMIVTTTCSVATPANPLQTATIVSPNGARLIAPGVSFSSKSGGDGWDLVFTPDNVYNMYHHQLGGAVKVDCHVKATGQPCVGYENGAVSVFPADVRNTGNPFLFWDDARKKVYTWSANVTNTVWQASVSCIDLSVAPPKYCGTWPVSSLGATDSKPEHGPGGGARIGNEIYAMNARASAIPYNNQNMYMFCFNIATKIPCAGQPYKIANMGPQNTVSDPRTAWTLVSGGLIYIHNPIDNPTNPGQLTCWNPATKSQCPGVWPVALPKELYQRPVSHPGSIPQQFPYLASGGAVEDGVCIGGVGVEAPLSVPQCWNSIGTPLGPLPGWKSTIRNANIPISGTIYNKRFYQASNTGVACYSFPDMKSCDNFPSNPGFTDTQYCVRSDEFAPGCLWISSDSGEIKNFDWLSGRLGCGANPYGQVSLSPLNGTCYRNITKFIDFTVNYPPINTYSSAIVNVTSNALGKVVLSQPLVNGKLSLASLDPAVVGDDIDVTASFADFKCPSGLPPNQCSFNATLTYSTSGTVCCDRLSCYFPQP